MPISNPTPKYTDAEAKAAAVQAGAITNGVTKAPTHDAVYDVKQTADAALPSVDEYTDVKALAAAIAGGLIKATSGSYSGNEAANRAIAHELGVTPKLVFIVVTGATSCGTLVYRIMTDEARVYYLAGGTDSSQTVTAMNSTNFYVGHVGVWVETANASDILYKWVAIG